MAKIGKIVERLDIGLEALRSSIEIGELPIVIGLSDDELKEIELTDLNEGVALRMGIEASPDELREILSSWRLVEAMKLGIEASDKHPIAYIPSVLNGYFALDTMFIEHNLESRTIGNQLVFTDGTTVDRIVGVNRDSDEPAFILESRKIRQPGVIGVDLVIEYDQAKPAPGIQKDINSGSSKP